MYKRQVTDDCGNVTTDIQTISVLDTIAPIVVFPNDTTLYLDASCVVDTTITSSGDVSVVNNCGTTTTNYVDVINTTAGCTSGYEVERTWTVTDDCGNVTTDIQTISVLDTIAPIVVFPNDTTLYLDANCLVDTTITSSGDVSVVNNCGTTTTNYVDVINTTAGCTSGYEVERTWTVTDDCGNVTTDIQTISVLDTIAPLVVFPNDTTLYLDASCLVDTTIISAGTVDVTNNCGTISATYSDVIQSVFDCDSGYEVERLSLIHI